MSEPCHLRSWLADYAAATTESPIESMMLMALLAIRAYMEHSSTRPEALNLRIEQQARVGSYRVDFMLSIDGFKAKVGVECDGHDFHERTKAQAAHDKKRDRAITAKGITLQRYTGSEIYRDPFACAEEAVDQILALVTDELYELSKRKAS